LGRALLLVCGEPRGRGGGVVDGGGAGSGRQAVHTRRLGGARAAARAQRSCVRRAPSSSAAPKLPTSFSASAPCAAVRPAAVAGGEASGARESRAALGAGSRLVRRAAVSSLLLVVRLVLLLLAGHLLAARLGRLCRAPLLLLALLRAPLLHAALLVRRVLARRGGSGVSLRLLRAGWRRAARTSCAVPAPHAVHGCARRARAHRAGAAGGGAR
jgi:hypothetical protein